MYFSLFKKRLSLFKRDLCAKSELIVINLSKVLKKQLKKDSNI